MRIKDCEGLEPPKQQSNLTEHEGDLNSWKPDSGDKSCIKQYMAHEIKLNKSTTRDHSENRLVVIIGDETCDGSGNFCNGPLRPSTRYAVMVRGYTNIGFTDSNMIPYETQKPLAFLLIFSAIVSILFSAFFIGLAISWRNNKNAKSVF